MEKRKKRLQGVVVSNSPQKSIVVKVSVKKKHTRYGKQIIWSKKYMVHDEESQCQVGDTVGIIESRSFSRRKAFKLNRIISKAEVIE